MAKKLLLFAAIAISGLAAVLGILVVRLSSPGRRNPYAEALGLVPADASLVICAADANSLMAKARGSLEWALGVYDAMGSLVVRGAGVPSVGSSLFLETFKLQSRPHEVMKEFAKRACAEVAVAQFPGVLSGHERGPGRSGNWRNNRGQITGNTSLSDFP